MEEHGGEWSRRRPGHPRFPLRVPAVAEQPNAPSEAAKGKSVDLSRGGVGLRLGRDFAIGSPVRITLRLRALAPLILQGRIAWVQPHPDFAGWSVGVQLSDELSGELVAEIADVEYAPWRPRGD